MTATKPKWWMRTDHLTLGAKTFTANMAAKLQHDRTVKYLSNCTTPVPISTFFFKKKKSSQDKKKKGFWEQQKLWHVLCRQGGSNMAADNFKASKNTKFIYVWTKCVLCVDLILQLSTADWIENKFRQNTGICLPGTYFGIYLYLVWKENKGQLRTAQ